MKYTKRVADFCQMCGAYVEMLTTENETNAIDTYRFDGGIIQELLPTFNPMEREFVKTGTCPKCQKTLFGTEYKSDRFETFALF